MKTKLIVIGIALIVGVGLIWLRNPMIDPVEDEDVSNESIELLIWQTESDTKARAVLDQVAREFEKLNDNVTVSVVLYSWNSQAEKLVTGLRSKNLPDIAHVQPFMVRSLVNRGKLTILDDLVANIEMENGAISESIKNIAFHENHHYGIPYAVGTTAWSYRNDIVEGRYDNVESWSDFIEVSKTIKSNFPDFNILLPGASSFFLEQFYCELLANNNGKMFSANGEPLFLSKSNREVLEFLRALNKEDLLNKDWRSVGYLDQFVKLAQGEADCVPITYARASRTIESELGVESEINYKDTFKWMKQPVGPSSNGTSIATVDCEPWVVFKNVENNQSERRIELSKQFLRSYYQRQNYMEFVKTVPIHLTPIFRSLAQDNEYRNTFGDWSEWALQTEEYLVSEDTVRPILMPDNSSSGKQWGFLLELQYRGILATAVVEALGSSKNIDTIAEEMQEKAEAFLASRN